MTTKFQVRTIGTPRVERTGQAVEFIEHVLTAYPTSGTRLRVLIHSDAYQVQSWGKVERWDGAAWCEVARMSGESLTVGKANKLYVMRDCAAELFTADRLRLVQLAGEVLGEVTR